VQSKTWKVRPSDLLGVHDDYLAWCVNEAVYEFGTACEEAVEDARTRKKGKADQKAAAGENALRRMLGLDPKFRGIEALMK